MMIPTMFAMYADETARLFSPKEAGRGDCRGLKLAGLFSEAGLALFRRCGGFSVCLFLCVRR